jgi:hypothetical protein
MLKYIIFFCCYIGKAQEPNGQIVIRYDTVEFDSSRVEAFGVNWLMIDMSKSHIISDGGVKVVDAKIILKHPTEDITAYLEVKGRRVTFIIPSVEVATLEQLPHTDKEYPEDF